MDGRRGCGILCPKAARCEGQTVSASATLREVGRRKGLANNMQRQPTDSTNQPAEQVTPVIQKPEFFRPDESDRLVRAKGKTHGFDAERAVRMGKAVLGCLLEEPGLWRDANSLDADHFVLADHRKIFGAIAFLNERGCSADIISVSNQLGETVAHGGLAVLLDGVMPKTSSPTFVISANLCATASFNNYLNSSQELQPQRIAVALLDAMREVIAGESAAQNWRGKAAEGGGVMSKGQHRLRMNLRAEIHVDARLHREAAARLDELHNGASPAAAR